MSNLRIESLDTATLSDFTCTITNTKDGQMPEKSAEIRELYSTETQTAGIRELAFMMNQLELSSICDNYLHVQYKEGANKKNRMMLSKRFIESFDDLTVETWFKNCTDREILTQLCFAMDVEVTAKTSINQMQQYCVEQVYEFGERVVLHRLSVDQLRVACKKLKIKGSQYTSSKNILINAIISGTAIPKPVTKKVEITRKRPIGKATQYNELMQHYKAQQLHDWAAKNGLKTSGTKKVLIDRILAYNAGDKENTMADPNSTVGRPAKKETKKAVVPAKKETKKPAVKKAIVPAKKETKKPVAKKADPKKETKKPVKTIEEEEHSEPMDVSEEVDAPEDEEEEVDVEAQDENDDEEEADEEEEEDEDEAQADVEQEASEDEAQVDEQEDQEEEADEEEEEDKDESQEEEAAEVPAPVEEEAPEQVDEEEADEEEVFDEAAQQAAIDAERELRTTEAEDAEPEQDEMSLSDPSESVGNDHPTDIRGKLFAISGLDGFTRDKKTLTKLIEANGGKLTNKLTSRVDVLITAENSKAWKMANRSDDPAKRIFCAGEEYLTNFY